MLLKISLILFMIGCGSNGNNSDQKGQSKKSKEIKQDTIEEAIREFDSQLFSGSSDNDLKKLQNLIEKVEIFELDDSYSKTGKYNLLTSSLYYKNIKIVNVLLDILSKEKDKEKVSKFLNYQIKDSGDRAIHLIILLKNKSSMEKLTERLIELGADINSKSNNGETPLHTAVTEVEKDVVTLLLNKGADRNIKNDDNLTPLEQAKKASLNGYGDYKDIIELLEKN